MILARNLMVHHCDTCFTQFVFKASVK